MNKSRKNTFRVLCVAVILLAVLCTCASAEQYHAQAAGEYFGQWGFALAFSNQKCEFSASSGLDVYVITDGWEEADNCTGANLADHLMLEFPPSPYAVHYSESQGTIGLLLSSEYIKEEPWILKIQSPGGSARSLAKDLGGYYRFDFPASEMLGVIDELISGQTVAMYIESDAGTSEVIISEQTTAKLARALKIIGSGLKYSAPDAPEYMMGAMLPNPADIVARPRITIAPAQGESSYPWAAPVGADGQRITPKPTATPSPTPRPTATPKPTPKPTATPDPWGNVPDYLRRTYSKGDSGDNVQYIKRRMRYLGYYRRGSNIDGKFNDLMAERLMEFQRNNGLPATGVADQATLVKLFKGADSVVHGEFYEKVEKEVVTDGRITLEIQKNGASCSKASDDQLKFRIKVKNTGKSKTVTAFELYIYTTDIWGRRLQPEGRYFVYTTEKTIKPGAVGYSDYFLIPDRSDIEEVHVAIGKVRYKGGDIEEVYLPDYWTYTID